MFFQLILWQTLKFHKFIKKSTIQNKLPEYSLIADIL